MIFHPIDIFAGDFNDGPLGDRVDIQENDGETARAWVVARAIQIGVGDDVCKEWLARIVALAHVIPDGLLDTGLVGIMGLHPVLTPVVHDVAELVPWDRIALIPAAGGVVETVTVIDLDVLVDAPAGIDAWSSGG